MPWHITETRNAESILKDGLIPKIGQRSSDAGETVAMVHLFSRLEDLESANWIDDAFDAETDISLLHVAVPASDGAWTEIDHHVSPHLISMVSRDLDKLTICEAIRALDRVVDPLACLNDFRATRVTMRAHDFGNLIEDESFRGDASTFQVYAGRFYIEEYPDGKFGLLIDRDISIGDLPDLESKLYEWALSEARPEIGRQEEMSI